ncbi:uncharacterized protein LOC119559051 isoform X2 [Drosophila subpulchrella]|uniref:uncharacterized protein LOC119559051 isoform X2 n=1 Tax=Drosophila subpulchrella TaxID=1486046 RepID=UPI0018A1906A|nr:uncharacterized protein LOC119559051 isoform X2 [Drosophila subpulchrella]
MLIEFWQIGNGSGVETKNQKWKEKTKNACRRKQYYNRANPKMNGNAGGNPIEKPIGKEHAKWDFAPHMVILPDASKNHQNYDALSIEWNRWTPLQHQHT